MDLDVLYNDLKSPSGLAGETKLYQRAKALDPKITLQEVKQFLKEKDSYTLHKVTRKKFPRRKIIAQGPHIIASMDLTDMTKLSPYNRGTKYMLVFIDVFSRYLQVILLQRKNADSILKAVKLILESEAFKNISRIHVDRGSEFFNNKMLRYLQSRGIKLYNVSSYEIKAAIAERVIQTIKKKIYKYLTHTQTLKYYDILPDIIQGYNHTPHRSLGLKQTPIQIHNLTDPQIIRRQFYRMYKSSKPQEKVISSTLSLGECVRLSDKERTSKFRRSYNIQNTLEIFKIRRIDTSQYPTTYYLRDLAGEDIEGVFYREELVPTNLPEYFPVNILRKKKVKGKLMYFVNWLGYPIKYNSWIPAKNIRP